MKVTLFVGGVGGAKFAHGLTRVLSPGELTVVVNTGDDFWLYGLRVCPDLDTIMYTLAGVVDPENGWGIAGDTIGMLTGLQRYGEDTWFRLGDQDLATHLIRTNWLHAGYRLTEVTSRLAASLSVDHEIVPMTDATVATIVDTVEYGELEFQAYFVKYRWQPRVKSVRFGGIDRAEISDEVHMAIAGADVILFGPSNPWLSIGPILALPGMRELLGYRNVPRIAVTPVVSGKAIKGPAAKMMVEMGYEVSASPIIAYYDGAINGFVYDLRDEVPESGSTRILGLDTIMRTDDERARLAEQVLEWAQKWT